MKTTLMILVIILAAGTSEAQPGEDEWDWYGGAMGIYFSDNEFDSEHANLITPPLATIDMYLVLRDAQVSTICGFECFLSSLPGFPEFAFIAATGPNGFLNYAGTQQAENFLVGYATPLPADPSGDMVLGTVTALYFGPRPIDLIMGPSLPSTGDPDYNPWHYVWNGPMIYDGTNANHVLCCHLTSGAQGVPDVVATINGVVVAVEDLTWSQLKILFE